MRSSAVVASQTIPKHTAWGTHCHERNIPLTHENVIESISHTHGAEHGASTYAVDDDVLPWDRSMRRDGRRVQLVVRMYNAPTPSGFLHTESGAAVRRCRLMDMACFEVSFKEIVNCLDLVTRQWPLPGDTILCTRHEINLVLRSLIMR